jgi:hypothetical protein
MSNLIELVCCAHLEHGDADPLVTTVEMVWAFCPGGAAEGHQWRRIEPTPIESLRIRPRQRMQELIKSDRLANSPRS